MYQKIIEEVCDQSQQDFEEGGVDQATLELLKTVCLTDKLTSQDATLERPN